MTMTVDALIKRVDKLAKQSGRAESTISRLIFKDGKRVQALREGKRVWPDTLARAERELVALEKRLKGKGR